MQKNLHRSPEMEKAYKIAQTQILSQKLAQKRVFCDMLQFAPKQLIGIVLSALC